jgi:hypothetical protein
MSDAALRYVVLRHDGIADPHFDLMFESEPGGALETWRSPIWPITSRVKLTPLPPHRRDYLTDEGPVSGGRGSVTQIETGTFARESADVLRLSSGTVLKFMPSAVVTPASDAG